MLFDFSNYWILIVAIAAAYVAASTYAQNNFGGKNRLKNLQLEMREVQKKMTESAKKNSEKELNEAISQNWKLTWDLMKIQFMMLGMLLVVLFALMHAFPLIEPGLQDDVKLQLLDDGLPSHCDMSAGDGIFSNCYSLPANGTRGAWVVDGLLLSASGEQLARNATAIYYEGGKPEDVWLQAQTASGFMDGITGKVPYGLNISTGKQNYAKGESVAIRAAATPAPPQGASYQASIDSGTFFYVDLPFPLPLINIRRIIGSYGVFLFTVFVLGIAYSIGKSLFASISKK